MNRKYVFFDCWDTVIAYGEKEKDGDLKNLYPYLKEKDEITLEQFCTRLREIYKVYYAQNQWEVSCQALLALLIEGAGLSLSISYSKAEQLICENLNPGLIPNLDKLFQYFMKNNIRCSVLSNTTLSEENTKGFIDRMIPNAPFEFVIASSRVGAKKPNPLFFKLGAAKAGVEPQEAIYIGDNFVADCYGSSLAGMQPVWFNWKNHNPNPDVHVPNYLEVSSYLELIDLLDRQL